MNIKDPNSISPAGGGPGWMTTFGDLLTLLLCFFLCVVSMSPLGMSAAESGVEESGIRIASEKVESSKIEFLVTENDYLNSEEQVFRKLDNIVSAALSLKDSSITSVKIESCFDGVELYESESWFQSLKRSLALRRQLIDSGLGQSSIALKSLGPWCEVLRNKAASKKPVARVILSQSRI